MSTINIIDTSQLLRDAKIIEALIKKNEMVCISYKVIDELNHHINNKDNVQRAKKAAFAKDLIDKNSQSLRHRSEAGVNADASILQIAISNMGVKGVEKIKVYTFDKDLAKVCRAQNNNPTIKHNCRIEACQYEKGKETLTLERDEPDDSIIKKVDGGECWRECNYFSSFDTDNRHIMSVNTESGKIHLNVIKYWAWHVKAKDYYKLYKKINLHKGDIIKADVLTFDNTCNVYARLCAYSTKTGKPCGYDSIPLTAGKWHTLSLEIDGEYDYINIEFFPQNDSHGDELWDGMDGFINCFHVERHNKKT